MNSQMKNFPGKPMKECPTRERILQAAAKLFAISGYHRTSLRSLAQEAQVNLAAVNYHFRTKEGLLRALIGEQVRLVQANFLAQLEDLEIGDAGLNAQDILECLVQVWLQESGSPDEGKPRLLSILCCDPDQRTQKISRDFLQPFYEQIFDLVRSTVPHLAAESARWRFNFLLGAMFPTAWMHIHESEAESASSALERASRLGELDEFLGRLFR